MHSSGASRRGVVKSCLPSLRVERSDEAIHSFFTRRDGLLRGACHRARIRATRWLAMTVSARRMGGAKRYPSVAVGEDDGFREGLNPSYRWRNVAVAVGAWLMFLAAPGAGSAQE